MNTEHYLSEVGRIIKSNFRELELANGMAAARAGLLVRQVLGETPLPPDFEKFSDALRELARRGEIRLGQARPGFLGIWLTEKTSSGTSPSMVPWNRPLIPRFRKLRNPLWLAFVAENPIGRRFMNKHTGVIRVGQQELPGPSDEWAEIIPDDPKLEREDAAAFLKSQGRDDDLFLRHALEPPDWWRGFSAALKQVDPILASDWNRRRSHRVIAKVEEWRKANNIHSELLYLIPPSIPVAMAPHAGEREAKLREAILSAVRQMSTEELLELRLPAKHIITALTPELLAR